MISVENSRLYTGTGLEWNAAVLYRRYDPSEHHSAPLERAFRAFHFSNQHGPFNHASLLFRLQAGNGIPCACPEKKIHLHRVAYSASWSRGGIYKELDRGYHGTKQLWDIQRLVLEPSRVEAMLEFLENERQKNLGFNARGMLQNFSGVGIPYDPVTFRRLKPEVNTETDFEANHHGVLKRDKRWFCSELVMATLLYSGVITEHEPAMTNPKDVCSGFTPRTTQ